MTVTAWALALLLAAALPANPGPGTAPVTVRLGTGTAGGGFQAYGDAVAEAIRAGDASLRVDVVPTGGTADNLPRLEEGRLDLGLATGEVAHEALRRRDPPPRVAVLSATYPIPGLLAVRADSPYHRLEELRGHAVVLGVRGSGLVVLGRDVLQRVGLDPERDVRPILVDRAADAPRLLASRDADALWGGGTAWPPFLEVARAPGGARFLAPSPEQIQRMTAGHPFLRPMTIPANAYPGQAAPIPSVGTWGVLLVRRDLPDSVVDRLGRALDRGHAALAVRVAQGRETTLASTAAAIAPGDLHPAIRRLLADRGLLPR